MALTVKQLYQMFQGDLHGARRTKQKVEQIRLESNAHYAPEAQHMFLELNACALAHDMTGVKRALEALAPYESSSVDFRAAAHYGRCEYNRMRGDALNALTEAEAALSSMQAGRHLLWVHAASAHVRVLLELGRVEQACALGEAYASQGDSLGYSRNHLRAALSLALLRAGDQERAAQLADSAIDELRAADVSGLHLAQMCAARAQIAAAVGDSACYERCAALYSAQWGSAGRRLPDAAPQSHADVPRSDEDALEELQSSWETSHSVVERAHYGLEVLVRHMRASGGALYTHTSAGLVRAASFGDRAKDAFVDACATDCFRREVTHYETEDLTQDIGSSERVPPSASASQLAECGTVVLGHSDARGYAVTGVVVLIEPRSTRLQPPSAVTSELSRLVSRLDGVLPEYL
jgi:hypothetical protein